MAVDWLNFVRAIRPVGKADLASHVSCTPKFRAVRELRFEDLKMDIVAMQRRDVPLARSLFYSDVWCFRRIPVYAVVCLPDRCGS